MSVALPLTAADAYTELCAYTLTRGDPTFVHQHVVDAYAAQNADDHTRPITLTFALVGLHLHVDKQYSGKDVQRAHQKLAQRNPAWPCLPLPASRGTVTAIEVMNAAAGQERDRAIDAWCASVWKAFEPCHAGIAALVRERDIG